MRAPVCAPQILFLLVRGFEPWRKGRYLVRVFFRIPEPLVVIHLKAGIMYPIGLLVRLNYVESCGTAGGVSEHHRWQHGVLQAVIPERAHKTALLLY
jgi:hypothetical protein